MFPRFSPDGTRVAYLQDFNGDECFDAHVLDLANGQSTNLMPNTPDEGLDEFLRWSPDGRWLAAGGESRKVLIWNRETGQAAFRLTDSTYPVWSFTGRP